MVGDTCMLPEEVNPVLDELRKGNLKIGIRIVAIQNHMLGTSPALIFCTSRRKGTRLSWRGPSRWYGRRCERSRRALSRATEFVHLGCRGLLRGLGTQLGSLRVTLSQRRWHRAPARSSVTW